MFSWDLTQVEKIKVCEKASAINLALDVKSLDYDYLLGIVK